MTLKTYYKSYAVPLVTLAVFTLVGIVVSLLRDWRYFCLFFSIGLTEFVSRSIVIFKPHLRQIVRRIMQLFIAVLLLVVLGLIFGVNFQFEQIFFDIEAGIVTGALIQLIVARIIIPFIFGNAFCSRACWDGSVFELINISPKKRVFKRKEWLAYLYMLVLVLMVVSVSILFTNPADPTYNNEHIDIRRMWILGSNTVILLIGYIGSIIGGSRFYCRTLCPFMTISSLFYKFSWYKITPVKSEDCVQCGKCNNVCPMLTDVRSCVIERKKVDNKLCILCERCVSVCDRNVLSVSHKAVK